MNIGCWETLMFSYCSRCFVVPGQLQDVLSLLAACPVNKCRAGVIAACWVWHCNYSIVNRALQNLWKVIALASHFQILLCAHLHLIRLWYNPQKRKLQTLLTIALSDLQISNPNEQQSRLEWKLKQSGNSVMCFGNMRLSICSFQCHIISIEDEPMIVFHPMLFLLIGNNYSVLILSQAIYSFFIQSTPNLNPLAI